MPILQYSACPQCGGALPIRMLWDFSRSSSYGLVGRFGTLIGRIGLTCPDCGMKLRVVQTRIRLFLLASFSVFLGLVACSSTLMRPSTIPKFWQYLGLGVAYIALLLLQRTLISHLAQVRPVLPGERLGFPLSAAFDGPKDSLLDAAESASNQRLERPNETQ